MRCSRREWLARTMGLTVGTALGTTTWASDVFAGRVGPTKRLLVLGGTSFVGPAIVTAAMARGHTVTLFNRGRTNPGLFPALEKLRGNRFPELDNGLTALRGRTWDVVIDTCGYFPRVVRASAELLEGAVAHYVYISSIAVYTRDALQTPGVREDAPLRSAWNSSDETERGGSYGARKALSERAVEAVLPGRVLIPRSTIMTGPRSDSDFPRYWPVRLMRGGEILAPGTGRDVMQYMDVNDLAAWLISAVERGLTGPYNVVGPYPSLTLREYLDACREVTKSDGHLTWVSEAFLNAHGMHSEREIPFWTPSSVSPGFMAVDGSKARAAGLTFRPVTETIRSELAWFREAFPADYQFGNGPASGITAAREAALLREWHASPAASPGGR